MTSSMIDQSIQLIAWVIALIELILGLYLLVLNAWHYVNRHASALLIIAGTNSFAVGWMTGVDHPAQAELPALLLAMTTPAVQSLLCVAIMAVVKPEWLLGRKRWMWWLFYVFAILPAAITLYDQFSDVPLWYSGLPSGYTGSFISITQFTQGLIADYINFITFTLLPVLAILLMLYFSILDRQIPRDHSRLARLLLVAVTASYLITRVISPRFVPSVVALFPSTFNIAAFAFAAYKQAISERRIQRGSLQTRLTATMVVVTLPLLIAVTVFVNWHASTLIKWIITAQRSESEIMLGATSFQRASIISLAIGVFLLLLISWFAVRHLIQPVKDLTSTANGVASGDLTRVAIIQTEDELGDLARAFNSMITQVRESNTNLQRRVVERNRDIERRNIHLRLSADVARQSASIGDLAQLLDRIAGLISDRFNLYHAGIFIIDDEGEHIVLRAASSPGGKRMLARNHILAIDQTTFVGYVAETGEMLISQDATNDTLTTKNVDLPQTRSEIALPLKVHDRIVGVLDVHSNKGSAFSNEEIEILHILSNQIAIAVVLAQHQSKNDELSRELGLLYQQQINRSWQRRLESQTMTFSYRSGDVTKEISPETMEESKERIDYLLKLPILLHDQPLGWISLRRCDGAQSWSDDEIDLVKDILKQIALALENARLMEENQQRAKNEALVGYITGKTQGLLDVESVMKTAVREIGSSLGISRVQINLSSDESNS